MKTDPRSKLTAGQVLAARRLYKTNRALTPREIRDRLRLDLSVTQVDRIIRGLAHKNIPMCGLPVRHYTGWHSA